MINRTCIGYANLCALGLSKKQKHFTKALTQNVKLSNMFESK